jgi:hypothetical protein
LKLQQKALCPAANGLIENREAVIVGFVPGNVTFRCDNEAGSFRGFHDFRAIDAVKRLVCEHA